MIFRNTGIVFFIFIWLTSCKGTQFYSSAANPANTAIWLEMPGTLYSNEETQDSIACYLVNHNSETQTISDWSSNFILIGQSRFYQKELIWSPNGMIGSTGKIQLAPGEHFLLFKIPLKQIINASKNWMYKNKPVNGPQMATAKKYAPYFYVSASFKIQVPNQQEVIEIRSEKKKIQVVEKNTPSLAHKKTILSLTSDVKETSAEKPAGQLFFHVTNLTSYPVHLFEGPGSVKFKIYAYNPNRTAIMHTECILDNGQLPIAKKTLQPQAADLVMTVPLTELMYLVPPAGGRFYWAWNKKAPPVSPLVYGKKTVAPEVEYWFGIVIDGKEYLSNTVSIKIKDDGRKKRNKK